MAEGTKGLSAALTFSQAPSEYCKEVCRRNEDLMKSLPDACKDDPDLQAHDKELNTRTEAVLNTLSGGGVNGFHSLDCLNEVTSLVCGWNSKIVNAILGLKSQLNKKKKGKRNSSRNKDKKFEAVVTQYISNSKKMLDFYSELDKFLQKARFGHFHVTHEINKFEIELDKISKLDIEDGTVKKNHYSDVLKKLRDLEAYVVHENFGSTDKLFQKIECLVKEQHKMLAILSTQSEALNKKLDLHHSWKKAVSIIFMGNVVALIICAVVTTLVIGPPAAVLAAFVTSTSPTMLAGRDWVLSLFDKYEETLDAEDGAINSMEDQTKINIVDLNAFSHDVGIIVNQVEGLLLYSNFAVDRQVLELPITQIKEKLRTFIGKIKNLEVKKVTYSAETSRTIGKIRISMMYRASVQELLQPVMNKKTRE